MGRTFSANQQPARRQKHSAYKFGKKTVRTAVRENWREAATASKSSISRGKLSDNDGKSDMEVKLNGDYIEEEDCKMTMEERRQWACYDTRTVLYSGMNTYCIRVS
jgi:hypothetical protein